MKRAFTGRATWMMVGSVALYVLAMVSVAHAVPQLDFDIGGILGSTVSYAGGAAPLVGKNIGVADARLVGQPALSGPPCVGCVLNFTTGSYTGGGSSQWDFGGGSTTTITIVGTIPSIGITSSTTLLQGTFGSADVFPLGPTFKIIGAGFLDTKDPTLLAYFGLPPNIPYDGNFNLSLFASGLPPGAFTSSDIGSGDVINAPTPEPGTLMLLGSGLTGLVFLAIRRRRTTS